MSLSLFPPAPVPKPEPEVEDGERVRVRFGPPGYAAVFAVPVAVTGKTLRRELSVSSGVDLWIVEDESGSCPSRRVEDDDLLRLVAGTRFNSHREGSCT